jgi:hypothetical protein
MGAKKSIYLRTPGSIPRHILIEFENRKKQVSRFERKWLTKAYIRVMTADANAIRQLLPLARQRVFAYMNPLYATEPELMIVDESIIVLGFNSPNALEIVRDKELAGSYVAQLKNDRGKKRIRLDQEPSGISELLFLISVLLRNLN